MPGLSPTVRRRLTATIVGGVAAAAVLAGLVSTTAPTTHTRIEGVVAAAGEPADVQVVEIAGHRGRIVVDNPLRQDLLGQVVTLDCLPNPDGGGVRCMIAATAEDA